MPMIEIGLGLLCAVAGGGAGWLGRGKYENRSRVNEAQVKKARRIAGGAKAAETRRAKAEKKAAESQSKVAVSEAKVAFAAAQSNGLGGTNVDSSMYGRGGNGELRGGR